MPEGSGALSFIGKNLASGAVSYAGGRIGGWVLGGIFGGIFDQGPSNKDLMNKMDEILGAVQQLGKQLEGIQRTLDAMQEMLSRNFSAIQDQLREIESQLHEIKGQELYAAWQEVDGKIADYANRIATQYGTFVEYAGNAISMNANGSGKDDIKNLVTQILDANTGAKASLNGIHGLVVGSGQRKGALQLWHEMISPLVRTGRMFHGDALEAYLAYYTGILYAQMRASHLIIEAYNQHNNNAVAAAEYTKYRAAVTDQEKPFLFYLEQLTFDALQNGAAWSLVRPTDEQARYLHYRYEYFVVRQGLAAGSSFAAPYHPTRSRHLAERLLAAAQALKPDERRVVVWMIQATVEGGDLKSARISLQAADGSGGPIYANSAYNVVEKANFYAAGETVPHGDEPCIFRRALFTTLPDGAFQLDSDMNNNHPQAPGDNRQVRYFLDSDLYGKHLLQIGPDQPFDFMDFATYPDPFESAATMRD